MVFPALLLVLLMVRNGLSYPSIAEEQWELFKLEHKKNYVNNHEERYRMKIFMENMHTILEHNKLYEMGASSWKMGMNQFGDLTKDEFQGYYLMSQDSANNGDKEKLGKENIAPRYHHSNKELPPSIDWRVEGAVTRVKNQKKCMACYAFSATGALEGQMFIRGNKEKKELVELSEQNIIDCTYKRTKYGNNGCLGGNVEGTFNYIIDNNGLDTEESYPFKGIDARCHFSPTSVGGTIKAYTKLTPGNETELQDAIASVGPVGSMVDAKEMLFYAGGIFDSTTCSNTEANHGFLVVGYGTYEDLPFWLIKNSWGEEWGEVGYMMMMRNKNNLCGIATSAIYPIV